MQRDKRGGMCWDNGGAEATGKQLCGELITSCESKESCYL